MSSFSEMQPILQQITAFAVSIKATSWHPSSCMIWPGDNTYICMPSKDSCQCLMSACLFLSRLKPVRESSNKIRGWLWFKRSGGDQRRLKVSWPVALCREGSQGKREMELVYFLEIVLFFLYSPVWKEYFKGFGERKKADESKLE